MESSNRNINNGNNANDEYNNYGSLTCHNSPKRLAHIDNTQRKTFQTEIKIGLLKNLYGNSFLGFDHENPSTHLTKFYQLFGTLGALEAEEEAVFMRYFPHPWIDKAKEWYIDQPTQVMTNYNLLEGKFLDRFFPQNKFMEAKSIIFMFFQGPIKTICDA